LHNELGFDIVNISAVALHDALVHFVATDQSHKWIVVEVVDDDQRESTFYIRPDLTRCSDAAYVMADDTELIPCLTRDGKMVDIILPPIAWKQDRPAKLRTEAPTPEEHDQP
jgi:hypothetical protein